MGEPHASDHRHLRLFIARSTPNSVRAEHNLKLALPGLGTPTVAIKLEIIDVFSDPHQALAHGVIVTPTLIGVGPQGRTIVIGDLADSAALHQFLDAVQSPLG